MIADLMQEDDMKMHEENIWKIEKEEGDMKMREENTKMHEENTKMHEENTKMHERDGNSLCHSSSEIVNLTV